MTACPDKRLLLHALVDDELDVASAAELETHIASCAGCAAERSALVGLVALVVEAGARQPPPTAWRDRAFAFLPDEVAPRVARRSAPWLAGGALAAIAASLIFLVFTPMFAADIDREIVEGHVRSLQVQHLVDITTSDRHVVKPWFNGKLDFAPPVVDLAADGFPLVGGRLDYLDRRTVAALVFRRRAHFINLYIWPGEGPRGGVTRREDGYSLIHWGASGLQFWAVSDVDPRELARFQALFIARTAS